MPPLEREIHREHICGKFCARPAAAHVVANALQDSALYLEVRVSARNPGVEPDNLTGDVFGLVFG